MAQVFELLYAVHGACIHFKTRDRQIYEQIREYYSSDTCAECCLSDQCRGPGTTISVDLSTTIPPVSPGARFETLIGSYELYRTGDSHFLRNERVLWECHTSTSAPFTVAGLGLTFSDLCEGLHAFVDAVIGNMLMAKGLVDCHGAVIGNNRQGAVFVGDAGTGKTTLAIAAARYLGLGLVSDDVFYVGRETGSVLGFLPYIGLDGEEGTRKLGQDLKPFAMERHGRTMRYYVKPSNLGLPLLRECQVSCAFFVSRGAGTGLDLSAISPDQAMARFIPQVIRNNRIYFRPSWGAACITERLQTALPMLSKIKSFVLRIGTVDTVGEAIGERLASVIGL